LINRAVRSNPIRLIDFVENAGKFSTDNFHEFSDTISPDIACIATCVRDDISDSFNCAVFEAGITVGLGITPEWQITNVNAEFATWANTS